MALLPIPKNSPDIGECIYCGSSKEPLRREHAVPYGLNGTWTLGRASCDRCANITHRFERDVLKSLLPHIRAVLAFQTRRPQRRPQSLPLTIESGRVQRELQVPFDDYPLYLPTPLLPPPGIVAGAPLTADLRMDLKFIHIAGPTFEVAAQRYPDAAFVGARLDFSPEEFARTLAKIAFCAAVYALGGVAALRSSPVRRAILGEDRFIGYWVGSWKGDPVNEPKGLHAMQVRASGTDIHVILRLFAQFGAPEYHVVLGPADPEFARSSAWPWK